MAKFAVREGIMLAHPVTERRLGKFPLLTLEDGSQARKMFYQPKLNGERSRTEWFGDIPYLISSYGNDFRFLDHIQKQLQMIAEKTGNMLKHDGEVYVHGWSRERIDSALRRTKNRSNEVGLLEYHIFDEQNDKKQYERTTDLRQLGEVIANLGITSIKIVPTGICDERDWLYKCGELVEDGYEGIIIRNPFGEHVEHRSEDLLKFKPNETDEYLILDVLEAVSKDGELKGMVGAFTVRSLSEVGTVTFNVGAGKLKHDKRIEYWKRREECIGRMLLVKHELLRTSGAIPVSAVTVDIIGGLS